MNMATPDAPRPTGAYTDDQGTLRCRATGCRCLGRRQALQLVSRARSHGSLTRADHCGSCAAWHYHFIGRLPGGRASKPRRQVQRRWKP